MILMNPFLNKNITCLPKFNVIILELIRHLIINQRKMKSINIFN